MQVWVAELEAQTAPGGTANVINVDRILGAVVAGQANNVGE
jgi:hypothetical protein